jgi:amidase
MTNDRSAEEKKFTRRELSRLVGAGLLGSALPSLGQAEADEKPQPVDARIVPPDEMLAAPVTEIARALRGGSVSSEELTLAYLRRIESVNPGLNAIVHVSAQQAVDAARAADRALGAGNATGPLHGVPMTLKDSIDTVGEPTTWGTLGRARYTPERDATVAARLKAAGAVLLGKTNTPEFTLSFETVNLVYGQTRNPFDRNRSPGGSSGGAAAAISAALCAFDIGSDTGGSIRVPSHCCGIAGLKPTQGRVPRTGRARSVHRAGASPVLSRGGTGRLADRLACRQRAVQPGRGNPGGDPRGGCGDGAGRRRSERGGAPAVARVGGRAGSPVRLER